MFICQLVSSRPLTSGASSILDPYQNSRISCCCPVSWGSWGYVFKGPVSSHAPLGCRWGSEALDVCLNGSWVLCCCCYWCCFLVCFFKLIFLFAFFLLFLFKFSFGGYTTRVKGRNEGLGNEWDYEIPRESIKICSKTSNMKINIYHRFNF